MLFMDDMVWSELARLDALPTVQALALVLLALALMPAVLQLFGTLFRLGFILSAVLIPVYFVSPMLQ
jgi:hypothetical protein